MSENVLRLIPSDSLYVPCSAAQEQVRNLLVILLPEGDVQVTVTKDVSFIDQGGNFERIFCPVRPGILFRSVVNYEHLFQAD